jgi:hypothetical protein
MRNIDRILLGGFLALGLFHSAALAGTPDSYEGMPQLKEKKVYTATGKEDWSKTTGFGANTAMNEMMNQMMVGGSGMENMRMDMPKMDDSGKNDDSMQMADKGGMDGMDMGRAQKPSSKSKKTATQPSVEIKASLQTEPPKVGYNLLTFTVTDKATGKPLEKLKVAAKVFMTSMDMGTDKPKVEELGKGRYQVKVSYSMAGPWRVELTLAILGQKPVVKNLDYNVQMPD